MTPTSSETNGCDVDAFKSIAPTGFSEESARAALPLIELKSKLWEPLHEKPIVFGSHYDVIAININVTQAVMQAAFM